jgi:SNF2 family DNA or RNA helicase
MENEKLLATIEKLRQVRTKDDLKAPPSNILKTTLDNGNPLTLRQYQIQGILHLLAMPRFVLGDDTGLGKTLQTIAALSYLWDKNPNIPALICTTKSAVGQWESEFDRFTNGVKVFKVLGTKPKRQKTISEFKTATGPKVLILGYRTAVMDFDQIQMMSGHVMVFDEATAFKNDTAQVHQVCKHMAGSAERVWSLSATIIKNRLMEAWAIYKVTVPTLFTTKASFMRHYCVTRDQIISGGRRIPVVVGHRKSDIEAFRNIIDPYFLGRPKHEVAKELPPLTTKIIECELSKAQEEKYAEALSGLLGYLDENTKEFVEREVTKLTAVTVCQQIVNHPELVSCEGDSGKLDSLLDLLENEMEGEKVIIFSRFRQMVDILEKAINKAGVKTVRITGSESGDERLASQKAFQDEKSEVKVCLITMAAAEGVNLQLAKAVIFYDTPWSAGDYLQIVGRMIRIGSIHDKVFSYHLVAPKTIDDRVIKTLKAKMGLIESVLGKRLKADEDSDMVIDVGTSEIADLFDGLLEDARSK